MYVHAWMCVCAHGKGFSINRWINFIILVFSSKTLYGLSSEQMKLTILFFVVCVAGFEDRDRKSSRGSKCCTPQAGAPLGAGGGQNIPAHSLAPA